MSNNNSLTLHHYATEAYLDYAMATVRDRALAQVQDGQKPVQRRILYAMRVLGLSAESKPVKSARIVGDVIGKFHPHGDTAAYDAAVRMAQPFTMRYPLIVGQGNFGSLDGDHAAAMRYTEATLSKISELLLSELGQGTVDFVDNYDGTLKEPKLLPARLPFLLLNGTMGIAVGMASDIPPHNLREVAAACVAAVKNPELSPEEALTYIQGPDFPGGAQVISTPAEILAAYKTGRGSVRCRAKWIKEDLARNQWQLVVTELPYQVSPKSILEQLGTLTNPQPAPGKKSITQQQANLKQLSLDFLEKAVDESDKNNPTRIVLVPRSNKVNPDQMMAFLCANTDLECNATINFTAIGLDGNPQTKNIASILLEWAAFRVVTVRRRTAWELSVAEKRAHILEGRMTVFLNLDDVIHTIREAKDPKKELQATFALSEAQAEDILEMRLRQLNNLEGIKIEAELNSVRKEIDRLTKLLASDKSLRALVVKEIEDDTKKFGDERRTEVKPEAKSQTVAAAPMVVDEEITVVLSRNLWVKAYRKGAETVSFKQGDSELARIETRTTRSIAVLDSNGRAYQLQAASIPSGRGEGALLSTLVEIQDGARVAHLLSGNETDKYLFAGEQGYGFVATLKALQCRSKLGKAFLTLGEGEQPLKPVRVDEDSGYVLCGTADGRLLAFVIAETKTMEKGRGTQLMAVGDSHLTTLCVTQGLPSLVATRTSAAEGTRKLSDNDWKKYFTHRAKRGHALPKKEVFAGIGEEAPPSE